MAYDWNKKLKANLAKYEADRSVENAIYLLENANTKFQVGMAIFEINKGWKYSPEIPRWLGDYHTKGYFVRKKSELLKRLLYEAWELNKEKV